MENITNRADLKNLGRDQMATERPLGMIVTWDVGTVMVPQDEMAALLQKHGLTNDIRLPKIRTAKALRRALEEMADDKLLRRVTNNAQRTVYALVQEEVDQYADEPLYTRDIKVTYWKDLDNLPPGVAGDGLQFSDGVSSPTTQTRAEAILRPLIDRYRTSYIGRDISESCFLATVWDNDGIPLREQGGAYFVPDKHHALFERLSAFTEELSKTYHCECYLHIYPVWGVEAVRRNISHRVIPSLLSQVQDAVREMKKMQSEQRSASVRPETIARHLVWAQDLKARAELYQDLLEMDVQRVKLAIASLVDGLTSLKQVDESLFSWAKELTADVTLQETPDVPAAPDLPDLEAPQVIVPTPTLPVNEPSVPDPFAEEKPRDPFAEEEEELVPVFGGIDL